MRIIFVRHGHPDYKNDCLTELGRCHAEAAAERLKEEKISKIFSSSCGRAYETAEHIAAPLGLKIEKLDFMREIGWSSVDGKPIFQNGHPWSMAKNMVASGQNVLDIEWDRHEPFCRNRVVGYAGKVAEGFDRWLGTLGYERDGLYYRVRKGNADTVLMASHAGSSSAALAHLFNLPFSFVCAVAEPDFTAITIVSFEGEDGSLISPTIEILNDARHVANIRGEKFCGK